MATRTFTIGSAAQPLDSDLTAIAAVTTTSYGRALLALADAAALRTAASLGSLATASAVTTTEITDGTIAPGDLSTTARRRTIELLVTDPGGSAITTGDGKAYYLVPSEFNNYNIVGVHAGVTTVSSSGLPTVQLARIRSGTPADVLTTKASIDASEYTSYTAATAPVVDTSNDDLLTGDLLRVDIDVAGTGAKGLIVVVSVEPQ